MKYSNILDNIFDVSKSIDLDNLVTDAFMEECAYSVPINNNTKDVYKRQHYKCDRQWRCTEHPCVFQRI